MIRVGLLGTGRIGSLHAETIASHRDSDLCAVSDIDTGSANRLGLQYGAVVKPANEVISDPNIDAILIATSTDTHSDFIEQASSAGKASFPPCAQRISVVQCVKSVQSVPPKNTPSTFSDMFSWESEMTISNVEPSLP